MLGARLDRFAVIEQKVDLRLKYVRPKHLPHVGHRRMRFCDSSAAAPRGRPPIGVSLAFPMTSYHPVLAYGNP